MSGAPHGPAELEKIYSYRFDEHLAYRNEVWKVLTSRYFSRLIPSTASVLDLGCGYGEFINNIRCAKKYAMDMNPGAAQHLSAGINFVMQDCSREWALAENSLDAIFTSNFLEHLPSKMALSDTLVQIRRCLKPGGTLIAMGPNVRFVGGAYWDFWDHHLPLTDEALAEALRIHGFQVASALAKFIPYTMVNRRSVPRSLISLYLDMPFLWKIFGKQFLVVGRKT